MTEDVTELAEIVHSHQFHCLSHAELKVLVYKSISPHDTFVQLQF